MDVQSHEHLWFVVVCRFVKADFMSNIEGRMDTTAKKRKLDSEEHVHTDSNTGAHGHSHGNGGELVKFSVSETGAAKVNW